MADGVHIRHRTARSQLVLVPHMHLPKQLDSVRKCNACNVIHPVKTTHLWVDDTGGAIVSTGVYKSFLKIGMPDMDLVGVVKQPPPLRVGEGAVREKIDQANRKQTFWQAVRKLTKV